MKCKVVGLALAGLLVCSVVAEAAESSDGDKFVTVPQKYVSSEGLQHQSAAGGASQWVGIGREVGIATREGLESVVDVSQKFGGTQVGRFVMFMVAWRVLGKQLLGVVLGIPIWIAGVAMWVYSMRRFFWGRQVITRRNADKSVEYTSTAYKFSDGEARVCVGIAHTVFITAWCITWGLAIFG